MSTEPKRPMAGEWWFEPKAKYGEMAEDAGYFVKHALPDGTFIVQENEDTIPSQCSIWTMSDFEGLVHEPRCNGWTWVVPEKEKTESVSRDSVIESVGRLEAWISEYGPQKSPEFIADLKMAIEEAKKDFRNKMEMKLQVEDLLKKEKDYAKEIQQLVIAEQKRQVEVDSLKAVLNKRRDEYKKDVDKLNEEWQKHCASLMAALFNVRTTMRTVFGVTTRRFAAICGVTCEQLSKWTGDVPEEKPDFLCKPELVTGPDEGKGLKIDAELKLMDGGHCHTRLTFRRDAGLVGRNVFEFVRMGQRLSADDAKQVAEFIQKCLAEPKTEPVVATESPDDWVVQDRVPARPGVDRGWWVNSPFGFVPAPEQMWTVGETDADRGKMHGKMHGTVQEFNGMILHLVCRRRDLPEKVQETGEAVVPMFGMKIVDADQVATEVKNEWSMGQKPAEGMNWVGDALGSTDKKKDDVAEVVEIPVWLVTRPNGTKFIVVDDVCEVLPDDKVQKCRPMRLEVLK